LFSLVWDIRANGCRFSLKKTEDSINSMITVNNSNNQPTLACASSDGTLTVIDLSMKKMVIQVFLCLKKILKINNTLIFVFFDFINISIGLRKRTYIIIITVFISV